VGEALFEYLSCYLDLVATTTSFSASFSASATEELGEREQGMERYLRYRIENDPARRLLSAAFGSAWTEQAIEQVMFPLHTCLPR
jgi:hypothetical protein